MIHHRHNVGSMDRLNADDRVPQGFLQTGKSFFGLLGIIFIKGSDTSVVLMRVIKTYHFFWYYLEVSYVTIIITTTIVDRKYVLPECDTIHDR